MTDESESSSPTPEIQTSDASVGFRCRRQEASVQQAIEEEGWQSMQSDWRALNPS